MKHRAGPKRTFTAGHILFDLFGPDLIRDGDNTEFLEMLSRSQRTIQNYLGHY